MTNSSSFSAPGIASKRKTGAEFDSSKYPGNKPINFHVGTQPNREVIKGLDLGLLHLKLGSRAQFFVRADHAYGERGHPPRQFEPYGPGIPPNSDVMFDIEVLSINGTKDPNASPTIVPVEVMKEAEDSFLEGLNIGPAVTNKPRSKKGGKNTKNNKKKSTKKPGQQKEETKQEAAACEA